MDAQIWTALIGGAVAIIVAVGGYLFTKKQEREAELRRQKLEHYKDFAQSLNGVMLTQITPEGRSEFARACNALNLIAPQSALVALQALVLEIKGSNAARTKASHDKALSNVFYELRKDLGISPADDAHTFHVELSASLNSAVPKKTE